jgi:riboflavin biosynthesis pyrimidine reductase
VGVAARCHHRDVQQIFPPGDPGPVDLAALYGARRPAGHRRPWVALSMISSLDGSTAIDGRSGGLGNDSDRAVFATLRSVADVILVGAGTAAAERAGQRIGVVTASGRVDTTTELFTSGSGFLVMREDGPDAPPGIDVLRAGVGVIDLFAVFGQLAELVPEVRFVHAEGGPKLNGALFDADFIDELNLTTAPMVTGGVSSRIVVGAGESLRPFHLAHVLTDEDGYLFTRWVRRPDATPDPW